MLGWTSLQRNAAIASFLSWALDAFDFFILVFLLSELAHAFSVSMEQVTLAILLTLAVRRAAVGAAGGEVWPQADFDVEHRAVLGV